MPGTTSENGPARYGERVAWTPEKPRLDILRSLLAWVVAAGAVAVSVWLTPGTEIEGVGAAFAVAALIGVLNAVLPPVLAALPFPFMLVTGFLLVLVADAGVLVIAGELLSDDVHVGNFGDALLASLLLAAVSTHAAAARRADPRRRGRARGARRLAGDVAGRPRPARPSGAVAAVR